MCSGREQGEHALLGYKHGGDPQFKGTLKEACVWRQENRLEVSHTVREVRIRLEKKRRVISKAYKYLHVPGAGS